MLTAHPLNEILRLPSPRVLANDHIFRCHNKFSSSSPISPYRSVPKIPFQSELAWTALQCAVQKPRPQVLNPSPRDPLIPLPCPRKRALSQTPKALTGPRSATTRSGCRLLGSETKNLVRVGFFARGETAAHQHQQLQNHTDQKHLLTCNATIP